MNETLLEDLSTQADRDGIGQYVVGAVITDAQRVLLLKRPSADFMGGIWELPSGKVEPHEPLDAALAREVAEETGLELAGERTYLGHFDYTSGSGTLTRQFNWAVTPAAPGPIRLTEHEKHQWTQITGTMPVTEAVNEVLQTYRSRFFD
ncbi:NUDIX domain-containing protein [Natronoglycomyces albus]|uniref:8-oxo-dGTP diphosphatase n=1 Tax=Natronoglycomyces albus TaxID=2811108 RepID=A0A895XXZ2_9ACTN|nr:NUDIX domain-containing protein [Natronoglycomyces albus]QSB06488.1 NUDIX domain-containing protein [Natronoglycomyces albus]